MCVFIISVFWISHMILYSYSSINKHFEIKIFFYDIVLVVFEKKKCTLRVVQMNILRNLSVCCAIHYFSFCIFNEFLIFSFWICRGNKKSKCNAFLFFSCSWSIKVNKIRNIFFLIISYFCWNMWMKSSRENNML